MTIQRLHRLNAIAIGLFLLLHMGNHAFAVFGVPAHLKVLELLRIIYRLPGLEHVLVALFALQIGLGLVLARRRWRPKGAWAWAQVVSGLYLVFFLIQHVPAILLARATGSAPDTDSHFAAAVVSEPLFASYFVPYYVLAVLALFTHIAAARRFAIWPAPATRTQKLLPILGLVLGITTMAGFMGLTQPYSLPPGYAAYLDKFRP